MKILRWTSKPCDVSTATSSALWGFRCTKLEWLNPTQQGTRADGIVPLALLSKLLYKTTNYYTRSLFPSQACVTQTPVGFSAANSCALGRFRCTKLEWLNPTQQGTRADVPPALLSKLLYETVSLRIGGGTSVRVPCYVGFSHSNLVHLNTHDARELAAETDPNYLRAH